MRAGKLDRKIVLQRATMVQNEFNEPVPSWGVLCTVSAESMPVSDSERVRSSQVGAEITMRFGIRYSSVTATLDPRDRLIYGGKVFEIVGIKELGRREGFEISARAAGENLT